MYFQVIQKYSDQMKVEHTKRKLSHSFANEEENTWLA